MKFIRYENNYWELKDNNKVILSEKQDKPVIYVGIGYETVGMNQGNFKIDDYIIKRFPLYTTEINEDDGKVEILFGDIVKAKFSLGETFTNLTFERLDDKINRYWIRIDADKEERCYGCGEQMSYFNLRGRNYPIWTSEPGNGRDKTTYLTWLADNDTKWSGGDYYTTYYPQPTFVSSKCYYIHVDSSAYSDFNFKNEDFHEIEVWEVPKLIKIGTADNFIDLLENLTSYLGRQEELPDWVYNGIILGLQGGNERVLNLLDKSLNAGIKISAVWAQDWCGKRTTTFGKRVQWDWHYSEEMYPNLPDIIDGLHDRGIKFLTYINPYLVDDGDLFKEGKDKDYFAKHVDGSIYLVDFGQFNCGIVDFTNPKAFEWFKNIIKKYMIGIGADGWMADFGEYLPTEDIVFYNGQSAMVEHNRWPVRWAQCNYEALKETNNLGKIVYFMRSGGTGNQKYSTMQWAGDQSVDFSRHDGLVTTINAALSLGMSGCGLSHSDIGGYTSLFGNARSKQLFLRWAEMSVFTPFLRSHEGNRPDVNFQYYEDEDCMRKLAKLTDVFVSLAPYTKEIVKENSQKGTPVQRPLFLHYEGDDRSYDEQFQYLYGPDILVAPVWQEDKKEWSVYLPSDGWIHFWSGEEYPKGNVVVSAPIGRPAVFYRKGSKYESLFNDIAKEYLS